jgi:hypothetical protein
MSDRAIWKYRIGPGTHLGTIHIDGLVFHAYEVMPA